MKLNVVATIAIPVGHRVVIRWHHRTSAGLIYGKNEHEEPNEPVIEDLETGIAYAFNWVLDGERPSTFDPFVYKEGFAEGVREIRSVTGRVTGCRIITSPDVGQARGHVMIQTELTIAEEDQKEPYR